MIWIVGTIVLTCGVAAIYLGRPDLEFIAVAGSLTVLGAMLLFAYLVFRSEFGTMRQPELRRSPSRECLIGLDRLEESVLDGGESSAF